MSYELLIQEEVIIEIQEAFEWYEKQKPTLGYELIDEIENCYEKICTNPEYYSYINNRYRRIRTFRFPYLLVYEIEDNKVIIISFLHAKQNSGY